MDGIGSFALLSGAVFLGAFVSRLAGFAFSAVAGAILLHTRMPLEAARLIMAGSVGVQATDLWALLKDIQWKQGLVLALGGVLGVPMTVWLLRTTDARTFRELFGVAVALYARIHAVPPEPAWTRGGEPGPQRAGRFRGRIDGKVDGDAGRAADHLVRHAPGTQESAAESAARPGSTVSRSNAGLGPCVVARSS